MSDVLTPAAMLRRSIVTVSILFLAACGPPRPPAAPAGDGELGLSGELSLGDGVTAMPDLCTDGADERCDALDSDCDGRIDEGCVGSTRGDIEVALAWNGTADVDLRLDGPGAQSAAYVSSRGDCVEGANRIERRTLQHARAGTYHVVASRGEACGDGADDATTVTVSVAVREQTLGTFNRALEREGDTALISFTLVAGL